MVKTLAKYGADLDYASPKRQETALMIATKANNVSVADQLIKCGANPLLQNKRKMTALDMAKNATIKTMLTRAASNWDKQKKTVADMSVTSTEDSGFGYNQNYASSANRGRQRATGKGYENDEGCGWCGMPSCACDWGWCNVLNLCRSQTDESFDEEIGASGTNASFDKNASRRNRYQSSSGKGARSDPSSSIGKKIGFYGGVEENSKTTARSTEKFYSGPAEDDVDDSTENETNDSTPYRGNNANEGSIESRVQKLEGRLENLQRITSTQERKIEELQEHIKVIKGYNNNGSVSFSSLFGGFSCFKSNAAIQETNK